LSSGGRNEIAGRSWRNVARARDLPGYRFPTEIIGYAVWLFHVFSLSLRDVKLILAERGGIIVARASSALSVIPRLHLRPLPSTPAL
jgi:transposase-like protein